ncbi:hypothetical protein Dda_7978 [Drechslerella dactyloides]|uniref:Uncharacterized protein n=1 Tax=Drechslerella dactyloides TaxID=74499 RepID=A0AAD6NHT2_DREDA|nr:hypothetical protein Dda_7978 [Drechslerella dactyloides]
MREASPRRSSWSEAQRRDRRAGNGKTNGQQKKLEAGDREAAEAEAEAEAGEETAEEESPAGGVGEAATATTTRPHQACPDCPAVVAAASLPRWILLADASWRPIHNLNRGWYLHSTRIITIVIIGIVIIAIAAMPADGPLADPALQPFLAENFSPAAYLNSTLPPLAPSSLHSLHSSSTSLLSSLDVHLSRLQATLSALTDEILRATPRLSYELQVLRSDVISLADTLSSPRTRQLTQCLADVSLEESSQAQLDAPPATTATTVAIDGDKGVGEGAGPQSGGNGEKQPNGGAAAASTKPQVLKRLETLALVRRHLEDVVKVFGEAMEWTLTDTQKTSIPLPTTSTSSLGAYIPPSRTPSPAIFDGRKKPTSASHSSNAGTGSDRITDDISYMLLNEEIEQATQKVEELAKLCDVWKNTSEYDARLRFVENLRWKVMEATRVEEPDVVAPNAPSDKKDSERGVYTINLPEVQLPRDGYLGLINQFKQMRDSIGQSG